MSKCVYTFALPYWRRVEAWLFSFSLSLSRHSTTKKQKRSETQTTKLVNLVHHCITDSAPKREIIKTREKGGGARFLFSFARVRATSLSLCSFLFTFLLPARYTFFLCLILLWIQFPFPALPRPALDSFSLFYSHPTRKKKKRHWIFCFVFQTPQRQKSE